MRKNFIKGNNKIIANPHSILLIQLGDIGDVVYSIPCVRALKENFPQAKVVLALQKKAQGLVTNCQWLDDLIIIDKDNRGLLDTLIHQKKFWQGVRKFRFDLVIDLRTGSRGAILAFLSGAKQRIGRYTPVGHIWRGRLFTHLVLPPGKLNQYIAEYYHDTIACYGIKTANLNPEITPPIEKKAAVKQFLKQEKIPANKPIWAIQPFSLWRYKEWAIGNYIDLINKVTEDFDLSVIITGTSGERERAQEIVDRCNKNVFNLAGQTTLELLPALLQEALLFFGVDSAGVHIAAAVGTPTISLYGPSAPGIWAPKGKKHQVISKKFPCLPCKETGCGGSMKSRCMDELKVEEIWPQVNKKIASQIR